MNAQLESLGRLRLQGILLLVVVFAIGALSGAAFERAARKHPGPPPGHRRGPPPDVRERLQLTAEQARRVEEILSRSRGRTEAILGEYLPRLRAVTDSVRAEVRALLTPAQQRILDEMEPELLPPPSGGAPPLGRRPPRGGPPGGPPGDPPGEPPGGRPPDQAAPPGGR